MAPAKPPSPAERNLPFHPVSGSQTSKRISESLVGAILPATRQIATGIVPTGAGFAQAGRDCARLIVVSGGPSPAWAWHDICAAAGLHTPAATNALASALTRLMFFIYASSSFAVAARGSRANIARTLATP